MNRNTEILVRPFIENGPHLCDKCGKDVEPENNAILLAVLLGYFFSLGHRHLLSVEGCEGSPSRAQYIEGQPRDLRQRSYPYTPEREHKVRVAYQRMQSLITEYKREHGVPGNQDLDAGKGA
jgi:hypothetical protein